MLFTYQQCEHRVPWSDEKSSKIPIGDGCSQYPKCSASVGETCRSAEQDSESPWRVLGAGKSIIPSVCTFHSLVSLFDNTSSSL